MKSAALVVLAAGLAASATAHASGVEAGKWSFSAFGGVDMPTSGDVHGGAVAPVPDLGPLNPALAGVRYVDKLSGDDADIGGLGLGGINNDAKRISLPMSVAARWDF